MAYSHVRVEPGLRVQWAQSSGSGARSWAYHGVGKVHIMGENRLTLCGRQPKWRNTWQAHDHDIAERGLCKHCERRAT